MTSRLQSGGGGSGSSSSSSLPMPIQPMPAQPTPVQLDVRVPLSVNARNIVQLRLGRLMTEAEIEALDTGLVDALSLLVTGRQEQRRMALQLVGLTSLSTPGGAQLWASILEAAEPVAGSSGFSVDAFVSTLRNAVSAIAGAQLASSFGL